MSKRERERVGDMVDNFLSLSLRLIILKWWTREQDDTHVQQRFQRFNRQRRQIDGRSVWPRSHKLAIVTIVCFSYGCEKIIIGSSMTMQERKTKSKSVFQVRRDRRTTATPTPTTTTSRRGALEEFLSSFRLRSLRSSLSTLVLMNNKPCLELQQRLTSFYSITRSSLFRDERQEEIHSTLDSIRSEPKKNAAHFRCYTYWRIPLPSFFLLLLSSRDYSETTCSHSHCSGL